MDNPIKEIIQLCLDIDTKARDIYLKLAGLSENEKLITFWNNMSEERSGRVCLDSQKRFISDKLPVHTATCL